MALSEDSSGMTYDQIILHYWKDYVNRHRRVLQKGGIDLKAVKAARSLPVGAFNPSYKLNHRPYISL